MSIKGTIIKNVFFNWGYFFLQLLIGFFMMPFMVHRLGNVLYGIWLLMLSLTGYLGMFDFGISGSIVKYVSKFKAENDFDSLNKVVNTSFVIQSLVGISIVVLSAIAPFFLGKIFKISPEYLSQARLVLVFAALTLSLSFFFGIFDSILNAYKRADIMSIIEAIAFIVQTALFIIFVVKGFGIVILAVILFLVNLLKQIGRCLFAFLICPQLRIKMSSFNLRTLSLIFGYSVFIFILSITNKIIFQTDNIVIGIFLGSSAITFYNVAMRLIIYAQSFFVVMAGVLIPFASEFEATQDKKKLKQLMISGTKYSICLNILIFGIFFIAGKPLIGLWMGKEFLSSYNILLIMGIPCLFSSSYFLISSILKGIGKLRFFTSMSILEAVINLILSVIFVKKLGIAGVALGTAIPMFLNRGLILPKYIRNILNISMHEYIRECIIPLFAPCFILIICLNLILKLIKPVNFLFLALDLILVTLIYFAFFFRYSLNSKEQNFYLECFKKITVGLVNA